MNLIEDLLELTRLIDGHVDDGLIREIKALTKKLKAQRFYVVVTGLFKRGKSTLINALLEKDIAPVAVTPLTAIVSVIDYSDKPAVHIHFLNGEVIRATVDVIDEYVTEDKNPKNVKQVHYVHILDNAPILKNISLVDTPGLGSAYEHNTEATLTFVPRTDAALFILSADIPISKTDIELLKFLQKNVPHIFYVFNKADLLSETDLEKIVSYNRAMIAEELNIGREEVELYVVSGKQKDIHTLRDQLFSFSEEEKSTLLQASTEHQMSLLRSKALLQIQLKRDSLLMPINELESKQAQLNTSIQLMNEQRDEFESIINGKIKLLQNTISHSVSKASEELRTKVNAAINRLVQNDPGEEKGRQVLDELNTKILNRLDEIKSRWEKDAKSHFKSLLMQYSRRSQSFLNELAKNLTALLGFDFGLIADQFDLAIYTSFYLTLDSGKPPIYQSPQLLSRLFPTMAQKRFKKRLQKHYDTVIVRNTSSIVYDLEYKIQESFRKFNYDLNTHLEELLDSITKVLESTRKERLHTTQAVAEKAHKLEKILKKLKE